VNGFAVVVMPSLVVTRLARLDGATQYRVPDHRVKIR